MKRTYRIRRQAIKASENMGAHDVFALGLPTSIGNLLPADIEYACELTEDGILYRPVSLTAVPVPSWAQEKP